MTTKQAAREWGIGAGTVQGYCKRGFVNGVRPGKLPYTIPAGTQKPYIAKTRKATREKDCANILLAVNLYCSLNAKALKQPPKRLTENIKQLQKEGFICSIQNMVTGKHEGYLLAEKGRVCMQKAKNGTLAAVVKALLELSPTLLEIGARIGNGK